MFRPPVHCTALLFASALLFCSACGSATPRKATVAVAGKVFWKNDKTPATGALVIFHPLGDAKKEPWPEGYPRGTVGADGAFKLTTYQDDDGAPVGEYAVLLIWPHQDPNQNQETEAPVGDDRLDGRYNDPQAPKWRKHVKPAGNETEDFAFIIQ